MRYITFILITLLSLLCTVKPSYSREAERCGIVRITAPDKAYTLSSPWYFRADDSPDYAAEDFNHTAWNLLRIGSSWTNDPRYRQYRGTAWYRLELYLECDCEPLELHIPMHYRGAQLYLNGKHIGETRPFDDRGKTPSIIGKPDIIPLPTHLLKDGRNILAVRTGSLNEDGGFFRSPIIGPAQMLHRQWVRYVLWYSTLSAISIFLALYFFLFFLGRRRDWYYLHFSGIALALGSWILGYKGLILWVLDFQWMYIFFTYIGSLFVSVMIISFLHSFMGRRKNFIARAFEISFISLATVLLLEYLLTGGIVFFQRYLYRPFIMGNLLVVIYIFIFCIQGVRHRSPYAKRILTGIAILSLLWSRHFYLPRNRRLRAPYH